MNIVMSAQALELERIERLENEARLMKLLKQQLASTRHRERERIRPWLCNGDAGPEFKPLRDLQAPDPFVTKPVRTRREPRQKAEVLDAPNTNKPKRPRYGGTVAKRYLDKTAREWAECFGVKIDAMYQAIRRQGSLENAVKFYQWHADRGYSTTYRIGKRTGGDSLLQYTT